MAISIYKYPQVLHLTVDSITPNCQRTGVNMIISQHATNSTMKLFRNTDQRIDLLLKDWDRRPVKFEEYERIFIKVYDGTREIMQKEADLLSWDRGHYALDFTRAETAAFDLGQLAYCIVVIDSEANTTRMLWSNQEYGAKAPLMIIEGPLPQQPEAQDIPVPTTILSDYFASSALVGAAQVTNPQGVHSFVLVLNEFMGGVTIEGTTDFDIPASDDDWADVKIESYFLPTTGTQHLSFTGNYNWVRIKFTNTVGLTSISYRNV